MQIWLEQNRQILDLELEPLCSCESCGVRAGCVAIVVLELVYVLATALLVGAKLMESGRLIAWRPLRPNFAAFALHPLFLYCVVVFDIVSAGRSM